MLDLSPINGAAAGFNNVGQVVGNLVADPIGTLLGFAGIGPEALPGGNLMNEVINQSLATSGIARYFNQVLSGSTIDGKQYQPDISGYTYTFMIPPNLSGMSMGSNPLSSMFNSVNNAIGGIFPRLASGPFEATTKMFPFLALDFTPPSLQIDTLQVAGTSGNIPYGSGVEKGGQCNITYLDTADLDVFMMHNVWVQYIDQIIKGDLTPSGLYLTPDSPYFGAIDYATSAYVIRCKPVAGFGGPSASGGEIVYLGKAVGIFPLSLPDKEVIGRRDSNELTTLPISYSCTQYRQTTGYLNDPNNWIYGEFIANCGSMYMGSLESFTGYLTNLVQGVASKLGF